MKYLTLSAPLLILAVILSLPPTTALAHTLKVENHIGAVLHTDPNDAPIAGTSTPIYLAFKNDTQSFDLSSYAISATITDGVTGLVHTIPADTFNATSKDTLTFPYMFPRKDVYTLTVSGSPTAIATQELAPSFTLTYDIRVDQEAAVRGDFASFLQIHSLHAIIVLIGIGIGTYITVRDERKNQKFAKEKVKAGVPG